MHRFLLLLMIVLLPLRAWAADAMALSVVPPPAASARVAVAAAMPPCHGQGASDISQASMLAAVTSSATPETASDSDHSLCTSCDICHGTVCSGRVAVGAVQRAPSTQPAWAGGRLASAVLPAQHKPPIS